MFRLNRKFLCCEDFSEIAPRTLWMDGEENVDYVTSRNYYEWYFSYPLRISRPPTRVLEIGIRYGYSAVAMLQSAMQRSKYVEFWGFDDGSYGVDPLGQIQRIEGILGPDRVGLVIRRANTQEMDRLVGMAGLFDIIHVDGAHTDDAAGETHDLRLVVPLLQSGGIIIVDDATDGRSSMMETIPIVGSELGLNCAYAPTYRGHIILFDGDINGVFELPPGSIDGYAAGPGKTRAGTLDRYTYDEVISNNCYRLNDRIRGGTVVDVGAHIGFFCDLCLSLGASFVDAYEANPNNFSFGLDRMSPLPDSNMRYRNMAVWNEDGVMLNISLDDEVNTGSSTVMANGEVVASVSSISIDTILSEFGGSIDLLKLDCEGSEYPIIYGSDLSSVRNIVGECHPFTTDPTSAGDVIRLIRGDMSEIVDRADVTHVVDHLRGLGFRTWYHPGGLFAATRDDDPPLDFDFE